MKAPRPIGYDGDWIAPVRTAYGILNPLARRAVLDELADACRAIDLYLVGSDARDMLNALTESEERKA